MQDKQYFTRESHLTQEKIGGYPYRSGHTSEYWLELSARYARVGEALVEPQRRRYLAVSELYRRYAEQATHESASLPRTAFDTEQQRTALAQQAVTEQQTVSYLQANKKPRLIRVGAFRYCLYCL